MDEIKSNPILKFNENHLQNVRVALGYDDVNKLKQDIEHLDNWIRKQIHFRVKDFDHGFLERMLIYNKGSVERAKRKLDKLCTCTNLMPEFLQNFDIRNEFKPLFKVANICMLPQPTKDNYRIYVTNLTGHDDSDFNAVLYYRYVAVFGHYMTNNDYCQGYELIGDSRNLTLSILGKVNPFVIHKGMTLITDTMGQSLKKIHLISGSKFFDAILILFKQGLSAKLKERILIHSNLESLYEHIPREQLPEDFGGGERSMKELNDMFFTELSSDTHIETVKFMEKASTDESLRTVFKFNEEYSGMPGSFKTLCVD